MGKLRALTEEVTAGGADRIVRAALEGRNAHCHGPPPEPLGAGDYDLVVGDLLYSQLLYPALLDCAVTRDVCERVFRDLGPRLTEAVVRRFHASTTRGLVVHLHDLAGWWHGNEQPLQLQRILEMPTAAALRVPLARPLGCDPRRALRVNGARILQTRLWRWPFCPGSIISSAQPWRPQAPRRPTHALDAD